MANHRDESGYVRTSSAPPSSGRSALGRRRADRPVDASSDTGEKATVYVGRRVRTADVRPAPTTRVPDPTTSFRDEATEPLPMVSAAGGKRRAERKPRGATKVLPSPALAVGAAAMAIAVAGTVNSADTLLAPTSSPSSVKAANALSGVSGVGSVSNRDDSVSRDSAQDARQDAAGEPLSEAATALAQERAGAIKDLAKKAETQADRIEANLWTMPIDGYRLSARFGEYGLWSSYHTGLDFAAPSGTPVYAIANGTVTQASYDGAYGNKVVLRLDDGTEIWYAHLSSYATAVGQTVRGGEPLGHVGSTGNSTGPHLHLEVRPGAGDPVDPYAALSANGIAP